MRHAHLLSLLLCLPCACPGLARAQADSIERLLPTGEPRAWLKVNDGNDEPARCALIALAVLDAGSTMRAGPHRDELKAAIRPAYQRSTDLPPSLRDRAIMAFALTEAHSQSDYKLLRRAATNALAGLLDGAAPDAASNVDRHGLAVAWGALALRAARQCSLAGVDPAVAEPALRALLAREIDPQAADLGRVALALALPDLADPQDPILATAIRLEPRDAEELAIALLAVALHADGPSWRPALGRLATRVERVQPSGLAPDELTALRLLARNAAARRSRVIRLDAPLHLRVLDAQGRPADGYAILPTSFWPVVRLVDGYASFPCAPLDGVPIRWSRTDPRSDTGFDFATTVTLGHLLGTPGGERDAAIVLHLPD